MSGDIGSPTGPTYSRASPHRWIDVVAATELTVSAADVVDLGCSDHLAVTARVGPAGEVGA